MAFNILDLVDRVNHQDALLVLGGEDRRQRTRSGHAYVLFNLVRPQRAPLDIVLSGRGSGLDGSLPKVPESVQMREFLLELGVPTRRMHTEQDSLDTVANIVYSGPLLDALSAKHVGIVTDPYHMNRALWTAQWVWGRRKRVLSPFPTRRRVPVATKVMEAAVWAAQAFDRYANSGRILVPGDADSARLYLQVNHPFHAPLHGHTPPWSAYGTGIALMHALKTK